MPKYTNERVAGYYLYFTSKCIVEAVHVHASDRKLTESGSAKFWVYDNGGSKVAERGRLTATEIASIQEYIKTNYMYMFEKWCEFSKNHGITSPDYYQKRN